MGLEVVGVEEVGNDDNRLANAMLDDFAPQELTGRLEHVDIGLVGVEELVEVHLRTRQKAGGQ